MSRRRHQDCSCQKNSDLTEIELSDRGLMVAQVPALPNLGLSETLATKLALDALDNFEPPSLAVPACRSHGPNLRFIPYKLFAPLDNCLFRGVLKDQVCLGWKRLSSESHGMTSPPGGFDTRITICLNKSIRKLPRQIATPVTLAALIHHMAHAYFMVCCGTGDGSSRTDKHSPCHGLAYSTLVHKIKEVFRAPEVKKLPSLFTCLPINPLPLPSGKQLRKPDQGSCSKDAHNFLDKETCHAHALTLQELKPEEKKNDGS
ncbi:hypothetical protein FQN57_003728 [Myotisia sp. PD_48]|nr:hypothetical protein FQN57_003728 [Myotisia sp. PD_48]